DRKKVAAIVFAAPEKRKKLESLTHPAIRERFLAHLAELEAQGFDGLVFWDAPVMIEAGGHKAMDRLVVVITDAATQLERAGGRGGDRADAERRTPTQMPPAEKAPRPDHVIDNPGAPPATEARPREVYPPLMAEARQRRP